MSRIMSYIEIFAKKIKKRKLSFAL